MREIKFRAWDKVSREMYYVDKGRFRLIIMGFGLCGGVEPIVQIDYFVTEKGNSPDIATLEDFVIMQFTGLKDKNGREIYEGDVIRYVNWLNGKEWDGHCHMAVIKFQDGKFVHEPEWCHEALSNNSNEVIGNIYENPELMGAERGEKV